MSVVSKERLEELLNEAARIYDAPDMAQVAEHLIKNNVVVLPCVVGDLVHFKGLETPWKVAAIHFYAEGLPQISIASGTGKITSTMNAAEFNMYCSVLAEAKMKGGEE